VDLISRRMRYDRLGINDALLQFESDLNRSLLPEPQRVLPMLDQGREFREFAQPWWRMPFGEDRAQAGVRYLTNFESAAI